MSELEVIHIYLFDRYDKLVVDDIDPAYLKQDDNDKRINIINLIQSLSHGNCFLLRDLLPKYIINVSYDITKKEYYDKYILEDINKIYDQYKCNVFSASNFFINQILKDIEDQKKLQIDEQKNIKLKFNTKNKLITKTKNKVIKKKKYIPATIKRLVWNTHIGEQIGKTKCMCCNVTDITQLSFNCGHIIAESKGGATIVSNLKPICQNCNSSMGTKNMDEFMKTLK
jgi:5-methylcytosine-specific restriction endonuclease McrA